MDTRTMSRDTSAAVKTYCYNNLREFYARHVAQYDISYQTFLRITSGEKVTEETFLRVISGLRDLNLIDAENLPTHFDTVYTFLYEFVKRSEQVVKNPNHENLKAVRELAVTVRQFLKPYTDA